LEGQPRKIRTPQQRRRIESLRAAIVAVLVTVPAPDRKTLVAFHRAHQQVLSLASLTPTFWPANTLLMPKGGKATH
jgi:hypothetical protein